MKLNKTPDEKAVDTSYRLTLTNVFSYARSLCIVFSLGSIIAITLDIGLRRYMGIIVDSIEENNLAILNWYFLAAAVFVFIALKFLLPGLKNRITNLLQEKMRRDLEYKAIHAEQNGMDTIDPGKASTYYTSDITGITRYAERILDKAIPDVVTFLLSIAMLTIMNPWLSVAAVLSSIFPVLTMYWMSHALESKNARYQSALERINQTVSNRLYNLEFIKANGMEQELVDENKGFLKKLHDEKKSLALRESLLSFPTMISAFITILVVSLVGGRLVQLSIMSTGELFSAIALTDYVVSPVMRFQNTISQVRRAKVNISRMNEFLSLNDESDKTGIISITADQRTTIDLDNLSFSYSDDNNAKSIWNNLNAFWEAGKLNIITGQNGVGKSTVFKLLSGVYQPQSGQITISGTEISDLSSIDELREDIVIDPQKTIMMADTVLNNITLGSPVNFDQVETVCSLVGIRDEILKLPEGFHTQLGSDGTPLSGGQKRRLCIARAMLKKAPIYLFDEPTVGIAPDQSKLVIKALKQLSQNNLVLVITHDPLLIQAADNVTDLP